MEKTILTQEQKDLAVQLMKEYLDAKNPDGSTPRQVQTELDKNRNNLIETELKPLLDNYLAGSVSLADFKSQVDGINKRNEFWGFKGIKGQMFFNMVVNAADEPDECDAELKAALDAPHSEEMAKSRIKTFASYINRLGEQVVNASGSKYKRPKVGSVPFFLSYFWQITKPDIWPVYYTNSVNTMTDLNLWQTGEDLAQNYIAYKHIHETLAQLFTTKSGKQFGLYEVEHVFWYKGGNPLGGAKPLVDDFQQKNFPPSSPTPPGAAFVRLPDSYVPPIISILPRIAANDPDLIGVAKNSGTSLERAFEKYINAGFTILGYDTRLLGQGQGRVPDGRAVDLDNAYAIIWDAKVRAEGYSMGTDDRTIREYVLTQSRELKRRSSLRNIYYVIVSSSFKDDYDDAIRSLKMETDVNEVCLMEAGALVAMVEAKLRGPLQLDLGPVGLQRLFSASGILTSDIVRETFA